MSLPFVSRPRVCRPGAPVAAATLLCLAAACNVAHAQTPEKPTPASAAQPPVPEDKPTLIAPDIKPEALWDGRKMVPFRALDDPKMVPASEAAPFLGDEEYVLGITVDGESRAYPTRFVWWHHFINDRVKSGKPVLLSYCSVCNTGLRHDPTVDGKVIKFDFYGLYNGVVAMCDRDTETVWLHVEGRAVKGPRTGKKLTPAPVLDTTWGNWKKLHPDTVVMSPDTAYKDAYAPKGVAEQRGHSRFPLPVFRMTVTRGDKRLPPFDKVLGVAVPGDGGKTLRRAYPIKTLNENKNAVNDTVASTPVVVFLEPKTTTAVALSRVLDGRTLTFRAALQDDGAAAFFDNETGTRWSIEGLGEEGMLAGKRLTPVENHLSQWYGWAAYFPETTIFGRTDDPQPGNPFENLLPAAPASP